MATGCEFIYDSNGDGTLDVEVLINVPTMGNIARRQVVIDCNLNQINFVMRAVVGTTLSSTRRPLDCPVSDPSFNPVSSRGKHAVNVHFHLFTFQLHRYCCNWCCCIPACCLRYLSFRT